MKYTLLFLIMYAVVPSSPLEAMKMSRVANSWAPWPPLLWITHQSKKELASQLSSYKISVADFIKGQLLAARSQTLLNIQQEAKLTKDDQKAIQSIIAMLKEYDARHGQVSFLKNKDMYQQEMYDHFPQVEGIANDFKLYTDINIYYDAEFPLDVYYDRAPRGIIFNVDNVLVLAHPQNNEYLSRPELHIGLSFCHLNEQQQWGAVSRQIAGHVAFEHGIERYLYKEVLLRRQTPALVIAASLKKLHALHAIEADLTPASLNKYYATSIMSWLQTQRKAPNTPHLEERITNLQSIHALHEEYEKIEPKD